MIRPDRPAVVLAPMEGLTDAPMRAVQAEIGAFTFAVSEFVRISAQVATQGMLDRAIPELGQGAKTVTGLPVYVQLLGGHAGRMAESAVVAVEAGTKAVDINFGCPAPTVNNHDGGASLLKYPKRIREIVQAIRAALPPEIPVSAKLRLGWDSRDAILENAEMAAEGGANWLTIHARTRDQGYRPPVYWEEIGRVRERVSIPVVANGDIWSVEDFRRCREVTGCNHFMLGRGALANPRLSHQVAGELGLLPPGAVAPMAASDTPFDWAAPLQRLVDRTGGDTPRTTRYLVCRLKQWLKIASLHGSFAKFDEIKRAETVAEIFAVLTDTACDCTTIAWLPEKN